MWLSDRSLSSLASSAGAAWFLFAWVLMQAGDVRAEGALPSIPAASSAGQGTPRGTRAHIEPGDDTTTLAAIEIALTQAGDGATYVWRRGNGRIVGAVRPTRTFRDADRRICRHIEMQLQLGAYTRRTEGIACRGMDGVWVLEG